MKLRYSSIIVVILLISMLFGCSQPSKQNDKNGDETMKLYKNLSDNTVYTFSTEQTLAVTGNDGLKLTTPNNENSVRVQLKDVPFTIVNWNGEQINTSMYDEKDPCWYLRNDFGFPAELSKTEITFTKEATIPTRVEIFISDDGYNFTKYLGDAQKTETDTTVTFCLSLETPMLAKAVKYYVFSSLNESVSILSINSEGYEKNSRKLMSSDKNCVMDGSDIDVTKLTDGIMGGASIDDKHVRLSPNTKDELMDRNVVNITMDLGKMMNVSEVILNSAKPTDASDVSHPEFVAVKYSEDGVNYHDFSMSYPEGYFAIDDGTSKTDYAVFMIMRNHTVKAKYLKIVVFSNTDVILDEIKVFGSDKEVSEPEYSFLSIGNSEDLSKDAVYYINGEKADNIKFLEAENYKTELRAELKSEAENMIITIKNTQYEKIEGLTVNSMEPIYKTEVGAYTYLYFEFDKTNVITANFSLNRGSFVGDFTINIFSHDAFMPLIRGGFYAIFIDALQTGYNPHHFFDEYRTYIHLKGFRELGMDTIIIGCENLNYNNKVTLIDPPAELVEKGYRKGIGHGVRDVNEAILNATDKLGMKAYISTVAGHAYNTLPESNEEKESYINGILEDASIIIPYIYDLYKDHSSFYGFYLTDETCDYWLAQELQNNTSYTRMLYKGQSEIIRSLDESKYIAIAPAAWRADFPEGFGSSLYKLIKSDVKGGRPIVDHVMIQDCLGREQTVIVSDEVYNSYRNYLIECKNGVERAGAVFMNDAETFDVSYRIKRYDELIKVLALESGYTNSTLIFDLAHYFSPTGRGDCNAYNFFDNDYVSSRYVKYVGLFLK